MKEMEIPIIIGVLETSQGLEKRQEELEIIGRMASIQATEIVEID